jgi:hypothetical protein
MTPDYDRARPLRIPDDEWTPFEQATRAIHPKGRSPRTAVVREFIRWYMHRPGAKLPKRPDPGPWSTVTEESAPDA